MKEIKLLKITQYGFYSGIESEKYVGCDLSTMPTVIQNWINAGHYKSSHLATQIIAEVKRTGYWRDKLDMGDGEVCFEVIADLEVF